MQASRIESSYALMGDALGFASQAAIQPFIAAKHAQRFGPDYLELVFGKGAHTPRRDDKRFRDPAW